MLQARIAQGVGVSASTVSRVLARAGLSMLSDLLPIEAVVRPSHRVTGNRRDSVDGPGWETLFVAIDDHARLAFTAMHPGEKQAQAVLFLRNAVAYNARLGVTVQRLLADNGAAFRSREFRASCIELGIKHSFTRPYLRQTNGKAERFSSPRYVNGLTAGFTKTQPIGPTHWRAGSTTTTGIVRTAASAASRPCPDSTRQETTS